MLVRNISLTFYSMAVALVLAFRRLVDSATSTKPYSVILSVIVSIFDGFPEDCYN